MSNPLTIPELVKEAYETARSKGWHEEPERTFAEEVALVHSEASEALEEHRDGRDPREIYFTSWPAAQELPVTDALKLSEKLAPFDAKVEADKELLKQAKEMEKAARRLDWGYSQSHAADRWEAARKIRESVRSK